MGGNNRGYATESLPNIDGNFYVSNVSNTQSGGESYINGAFSYTQLGGTYGAAFMPAGGVINFKASRSSSTYQDGAKVKPNTLYSNFIVKY